MRVKRDAQIVKQFAFMRNVATTNFVGSADFECLLYNYKSEINLKNVDCFVTYQWIECKVVKKRREMRQK